MTPTAESPLIGSSNGAAAGHHDQVLPAVLRPNRGPNAVGPLLFVAVGGFMAYSLFFEQSSGLTFEIDFNSARSEIIGEYMPWLVMVFVGGLCVFGAWREFAYFRSDGAFFLGLSAAGLTMSTPITLRHFAWQDLERFRVGTRREGNRGRSRQVYTVRADLKGGGWFRSGVSLAQKDFARNLGPDQAASAELLCAFLNEVRDRVREAERENAQVVVPVPYGLVVVETPGAIYGPTPPAIAPDDEPASGRPRARPEVVERKPTVSRE